MRQRRASISGHILQSHPGNCCKAFLQSNINIGRIESKLDVHCIGPICGPELPREIIDLLVAEVKRWNAYDRLHQGALGNKPSRTGPSPLIWSHFPCPTTLQPVQSSPFNFASIPSSSSLLPTSITRFTSAVLRMSSTAPA